MTKFTKEQINNLQDQAKAIVQNTSEGADTADIMAKLYVDAFDGKSYEQGKIIADSIITAVSEFDIDYKEAQVDPDHFIRKFQKKIDKNKTCFERCTYWKQFAAAVTAATIAANDPSENTQKLAAQLEELNVTEENANELLETKLRDLAFEAIKDSNIMVRALAENVDALEQIGNADEAAKLLVDLGDQNIDYRAIIAMLAYINTVKGEYPDIPIDTPAAQLATLVCVETEQIEIIDKLEHDDISMTVAQGLLYVLGVIAIIKIGVFAASAAVTIAPFIFGNILIIPGILAMIIGIIHISGVGIRKWERDSGAIVTTVFKGVRAICNGAKKLFGFIKNRVVPDLVERCKKRFGHINTAEETETTGEVVTEPLPC